MGRVRKSWVYVEGEKFPRIMYGLKGVMTLFDVSKATASRYAKTLISPAITRQGNVMIIDTKKALKCFGVSNPSDFVK